MTVALTTQELEHLRTQRLGRLATVDADGAPQNNPVGFFIDDETGQVLVGGLATSREVIRITPQWTHSWGVDQ